MNNNIEKVESGKLYEFQGKKPEVHPSCFLADGARIIGDVVLEENVSVWFNVVIRGDVERIGSGRIRIFRIMSLSMLRILQIQHRSEKM